MTTRTPITAGESPTVPIENVSSTRIFQTIPWSGDSSVSAPPPARRQALERHRRSEVVAVYAQDAWQFHDDWKLTPDGRASRTATPVPHP